MKTERLTILVTPEEKAAMTARAAEMHVSTSEMLRLAFDAFEEPTNQQLLDALGKELQAAAARAHTRLDEANRTVEQVLGELRASRQSRAAA
ncbi:MAG: hypothetical protein ACM3YN_13565 [Parcubacteria group bacterium]